jgi:hypothetical protein
VSQHGATEDLGLWLVEGPTGLTGGLTYHADLYLSETARRLHARFTGILEQIADRPDTSVESLLALDDQEAQRLHDWLATPALPAGMSTRATVTPLTMAPVVTAVAEVTAVTAVTAVSAVPATDTERRLAETWGRLLGIVGVRVLAGRAPRRSFSLNTARAV